ncbi:hypothetical protein EON63_24150 [archaeon]|nr:MAG: hypothetical protein EON63_24150 [archaeon]
MYICVYACVCMCMSFSFPPILLPTQLYLITPSCSSVQSGEIPTQPFVAMAQGSLPTLPILAGKGKHTHC